jgi:hypothetical protein
MASSSSETKNDTEVQFDIDSFVEKKNTKKQTTEETFNFDEPVTINIDGKEFNYLVKQKKGNYLILYLGEKEIIIYFGAAFSSLTNRRYQYKNNIKIPFCLRDYIEESEKFIFIPIREYDSYLEDDDKYNEDYYRINFANGNLQVFDMNRDVVEHIHSYIQPKKEDSSYVIKYLGGAITRESDIESADKINTLIQTKFETQEDVIRQYLQFAELYGSSTRNSYDRLRESQILHGIENLIPFNWTEEYPEKNQKIIDFFGSSFIIDEIFTGLLKVYRNANNLCFNCGEKGHFTIGCKYEDKELNSTETSNDDNIIANPNKKRRIN